MLTVLLILFLAVSMLARLLLSAVFLRLGARWARIDGVSLWQATWVTVVISVVQIGVVLPLALGLSRMHVSTAQGYGLAIALTGLSVGVDWILIARLLRARFWRAAQAWLPTLVVSIAGVLLAEFVLVPFVFEAYKNPTNGMAPTLLGRHSRSVCPGCGEAAYCSPPEPTRGIRREGKTVICGQFHTSQAQQLPPTTHFRRFANH